MMIFILAAIAALTLLFLLSVLARCVYLVRQGEVIVIERFGRFDKILTPGLHVITPFVAEPRSVEWTYFINEDEDGFVNNELRRFYRIDLRECVYDFPRQSVITKDNVGVEINALLYYQIIDPKAAIYEVSNLPEAIEKLTHSTLRNVIGSLDLDETLISRDQINTKLRIILDEATDKWGVKINRVELQEVNPPHDIRQAMEKQMRAERDRRAMILEAEGFKSAAILKAEGERESNILRADGQAQAQVIAAQAAAEARLKMATAEAQALEQVQQALKADNPASYLVAMEYIKTLPKLVEGQNNKLVVVPYEASSLAGALSAVKEVFSSVK